MATISPRHVPTGAHAPDPPGTNTAARGGPSGASTPTGANTPDRGGH
jgi:hypothetical protein